MIPILQCVRIHKDNAPNPCKVQKINAFCRKALTKFQGLCYANCVGAKMAPTFLFISLGLQGNCPVFLFALAPFKLRFVLMPMEKIGIYQPCCKYAHYGLNCAQNGIYVNICITVSVPHHADYEDNCRNTAKILALYQLCNPEGR